MNMRNTILGVVAGLMIGMVGALAYSHFLGEGAMLDDLQARLDAANTDLANAKKQSHPPQETVALSDQVNQLQASNDSLRKQLADSTTTPAAAPAPATPELNPALIGAIAGMMRGGGFRPPESRMFLMQSRLRLTADQSKAIKAAMDADNQARRDMFRQMREGGAKTDLRSLTPPNSLDKTLASVLSPQQQAAYQQLQSDEKASRAETMATQQVDQIMPLLQLTDSQKEAAMNALYQQQLSAPDPASLIGNPNALATLTSQGQTTQAALQKVLSQDQYTLYQQDQQIQTQAYANFGGRRNNGNGNGGNNGNGGGQTATGGTPPPGYTTTSSTTTGYTANGSLATTTNTTYVPNRPAPPGTDTTTNAAPSSSAPTTNAATTNAAPAQ
jgi:hypothetical protein